MPTPHLRILVVDGNTAEVNEAHQAFGGEGTGENYVAVLTAEHPGIDCTIVRPAADPTAALPGGTALADFDGIAWTGSALNIYNGGAEVQCQIDLARAAFASGSPIFGSCWGLQVATVAAGGTVRANPKGREIGFGRHIQPTEAGARHPMLEGRRGVFDAITVHLDEVSVRPPGMVVLASNAVSAVQAAEIHHDRSVFWGTQYHPEYDLHEIGVVIRRYARRLLQDGLFPDQATLEGFVGDLDSLHKERGRRDLSWRYGIDGSVLDDRVRHADLRNWLQGPVQDHAQRRA